jgi:hypothetical protein
MKKRELKHQIVYQNYQVQKVKVVKMKNHICADSCISLN